MEFTLRLPDVGEGIAEAELVEWNVKPGDLIREDTIVAAVMTDKATIEIPSPISGTVVWLGAEIGDKVAIKGPLLRIKTDDHSAAAEPSDRMAEEAAEPMAPASAAEPEPSAPERHQIPEPEHHRRHVAPDAAMGRKVLASPAVRRRALDRGVDLREVPATGPAGQITHDDLDRYLQGRGAAADAASDQTGRRSGVQQIKITGLRRRIAERMALATSRIPHITYVEEVDMTALEELRAAMNRDRREGCDKLTPLPFLMKAMARAIETYPVVNATFDDEAGIVSRHEAVHIGIATQTPAGLTVPVVRHVEARDLWDCAQEMGRITRAARDGTAGRDDLGGSTITISSLGALGGLVSTPIINHPEVAIVGVNKLTVKPHWTGSGFVPRSVMNLSSSFDHRIVDGWDAARFIQRVKALLETPPLIFVED